MVQSEGRRPGGFREIPRNVRTRKVQTELFISGITAIPIVWPISPAIIGTMNFVNAGLELRDAGNRRPGSTFSRSFWYGVFGLLEYSLEAVGLSPVGNHIGNMEANFIQSHIGYLLPDFIHPLLGLASAGGIGLITGTLTNSVNWELRRGRRD